MKRLLTSLLPTLLLSTSTILAGSHTTKQTPPTPLNQPTSNPTSQETSPDLEDNDFVSLTDSSQKNYQLEKTPVTAAQYAAFLNAVAAPHDPHHFYKKEMEQQIVAMPSPSSGVDFYVPLTEEASFPISCVTFYDAVSYCNWKEHGEPNREQVEQAKTETGEDITDSGAYTITYENNEPAITQNPNASYHLPSESELSNGLSTDQISASTSEWTSHKTPSTSQSSLTSLDTIADGALELVNEWEISPTLYDDTTGISTSTAIVSPSKSSTTGFRLVFGDNTKIAQDPFSGANHSSITPPLEDEILPPDTTAGINPAKGARKRILASRWHLGEEIASAFALAPFLGGAYYWNYISGRTFAAIAAGLTPLKVFIIGSAILIWWHTH